MANETNNKLVPVRVHAFGATVGILRSDNGREVYTVSIKRKSLVDTVQRWCADNGYTPTNISDGRIWL